MSGRRGEIGQNRVFILSRVHVRRFFAAGIRGWVQN
jgi:hypothetical protein